MSHRGSRESGAYLLSQCQALRETRNNMKAICNVLALVMLACLSLSAQQITGNIRGIVTDPTGAVLPGATVTAQQVETGLSRGAATDRSGNYTILELPVGHYRLHVAAKG